MPPLCIRLPDRAGNITEYPLRAQPVAAPPSLPPHRFNRAALAAAHVVADPLSANEIDRPAIDWEATLAFRRHLLDCGLMIAEAMDTAQRGMGLPWPAARELIRRSLDAVTAQQRPRIFCGVGTDHLAPGEARGLDSIARAYHMQLREVQAAGGRVIVMASRELARIAANADAYQSVYRRVLAEADRPVIVHWLGGMFDPALARYWGSGDLDAAADTLLQIIADNRVKVDGVKVSLLDAGREIAMRRRLPDGVKMYTGDDFNYPELIKGDARGHSHALLGIFDPIAPIAGAALEALGAGRTARYDELMAPTADLARVIFRPPTRHYKTGVVFLAWLNGFQRHFIMLGGAQALRPLPYFTEVFLSADRAGALLDPPLACARMRRLLAVYGIDA